MITVKGNEVKSHTVARCSPKGQIHPDILAVEGGTEERMQAQNSTAECPARPPPRATMLAVLAPRGAPAHCRRSSARAGLSTNVGRGWGSWGGGAGTHARVWAEWQGPDVDLVWWGQKKVGIGAGLPEKPRDLGWGRKPVNSPCHLWRNL